MEESSELGDFNQYDSVLEALDLVENSGTKYPKN